MWKYIPLLNTMIQILVTIGLGGIMGKFRVFKADQFVPLAVRFVFFVGLPCLVIKVSPPCPDCKKSLDRLANLSRRLLEWKSTFTATICFGFTFSHFSSSA